MFGLNPWFLLGIALAIAGAWGGGELHGRFAQSNKDSTKIGGLELANKTFAEQQAAAQVEAIKTAAKIEEAEKLAADIAKLKGDTILRINSTPIAPGCEPAMQFLRDEAVRAQTARRKFNETHPH